MKQFRIISVLLAIISLFVMGEAAAMGSKPEEQPQAASSISYRSTSMRGGRDISISVDRKLHFEGSGNTKPKVADATITEAEFKELQDIIHSKEFLALDKEYINRDVRDGFAFYLDANGKSIAVENHEPPAVLKKLTMAINKLSEEYVEKDNDE